jgi:formate hydrogenlyase subunit 3/multisubunit Na+/H+ antiporter MnhD subunit
MIVLVSTLALMLLAIGVVSPFLRRDDRAHAFVYGASVAVTTALGVAATVFLVSRSPATAIVWPVGLPWLDANLRLDALSAYFIAVVNFVAAAVSVFGWGYATHDDEPKRVRPFYSVFIAACNFVLLADDAFVFLLSWEFISLSSWFLIMANHRQVGTPRAALVYLVMASFGTLVLLFAFGLLSSPAGSYGFEAMRAHPAAGALASVAMLLALVGAGSKAGLVPLHVWLPLAHPAAPSHVSALLSGVMTKVAIYGLVRIVFDLIGNPQWWWGEIVLLIGGISAVLGVLYALMQHDLKTLLAYHTVENIGIITIGLGLALLFQSNGLHGLATLSLTAALLHVFNHALFKSLLFCGAGAIVVATGERDLERLGGLIRGMPLTGLCFLVGCVAISGLPPLNGFVSEWLTFQAIFSSAALTEDVLRLVVPMVGAMLALSAALAAACFVKVFGIAFLGRPRSPAAKNAFEQGGAIVAGLAVMAVVCVAFGVLPGLAVALVEPATKALVGGELPAHAGGWIRFRPLADESISYSGLAVLVLVVAIAGGTAAAFGRFGRRGFRRSAPWDCGFPDADPATQYTASSFAQPIRRVFGRVVFLAQETVTMPPPGDVRPARLEVVLIDPAWNFLFQPLLNGLDYVTNRANVLQFFPIRRYLGFVFSALVVLLLVVVLAQ